MRRLGLIAVVLAAVAVGGCVPLKQGAPPCSPSPNLAYEVFEAVNVDRAAAGVPPVVWDQSLADSARAWAQHMADVGVLYHSPDSYRRGHGRYVSELIAGPSRCNVTAVEIEASWMGSPAHAHGIVDPLYVGAGIAVVADARRLWTVMWLGS